MVWADNGLRVVSIVIDSPSMLVNFWRNWAELWLWTVYMKPKPVCVRLIMRGLVTKSREWKVCMPSPSLSNRGFVGVARDTYIRATHSDIYRGNLNMS